MGGHHGLLGGEAFYEALPAGLAGEDFDFDAEVVDGDLGVEDAGYADGVFLGGQDGADVLAGAAADELLDLTHGVAVVIRVGF